MPTPESLLGRVWQAAMTILLVAVVVSVGWHLIKPVVPAALVLVAFALLFRFVLRHR